MKQPSAPDPEPKPLSLDEVNRLIDNNSANPGEYGGITNEQCLRQWGFAGKDYANDQLAGRSVNLVSDPIAGDRDTYDRLLVYVEINGYDFSQLLVEYGLARAATEWASSRVSSYVPYQEAVLLRVLSKR